METNELTTIDDKLVDTSTIETTVNIHSLLNIESRVGGCTEGRAPKGLLSQGALPVTTHVNERTHVRGLVYLGLPFDLVSIYLDPLHSFRLIHNFYTILHIIQPHF